MYRDFPQAGLDFSPLLYSPGLGDRLTLRPKVALDGDEPGAALAADVFRAELRQLLATAAGERREQEEPEDGVLIEIGIDQGGMAVDQLQMLAAEGETLVIIVIIGIDRDLRAGIDLDQFLFQSKGEHAFEVLQCLLRRFR